MPKYRNDNAHPVTFGGVALAPGEERSVHIFLPCDGTGITKVADEPLVASPIILAESVTLEAGVSQEIEIPCGADRISLSVMVGSGEDATLKLGDSPVEIPLNDATGGYVMPSSGFPWCKIAKITLDSEIGATATILVEGVV